MRKPPRAAPYEDWEELVQSLSSQFNGEVLGLDEKIPDDAKQLWTEPELQMYYASGGMILPPDDPKLRAAAAKASASMDLRSNAQIDADEMLKKAQDAARNAPWWAKVSELDKEKASMYRDAALSHGIPDRPHGLYPTDDPLIKELTKDKTMLPFEKHIMFWDTPNPIGKPDVKRICLHADEGFTHGNSACIGRGLDFRYYWDSIHLKVVAAVRYSRAAVGGWSSLASTDSQDESPPWANTLVHGGCVEAVLDELTAEVMKINISPEMVTSEMTVKLKKPSVPGQTYRAEAMIESVSPPRVVIKGTIKTLAGEDVAIATATCVMMDKMPKSTDSRFQDPEGDDNGVLPMAVADQCSVTKQLGNRAGGGGEGAPAGLPPPPPSAASAGGGGGSIEGTLADLKALQAKLVTLLQSEYFCDDVEPPATAFGWEEQRLRDFFENGGE